MVMSTCPAFGMLAKEEDWPDITSHDLEPDLILLNPIFNYCKKYYLQRGVELISEDRDMCLKGMAYAHEYKVKNRYNPASSEAYCYYAAAVVIVLAKFDIIKEPKKKHVLSVWNRKTGAENWLKQYRPDKLGTIMRQGWA